MILSKQFGDKCLDTATYISALSQFFLMYPFRCGISAANAVMKII